MNSGDSREARWGSSVGKEVKELNQGLLAMVRTLAVALNEMRSLYRIFSRLDLYFKMISLDGM